MISCISKKQIGTFPVIMSFFSDHYIAFKQKPVDFLIFRMPRTQLFFLLLLFAKNYLSLPHLIDLNGTVGRPRETLHGEREAVRKPIPGLIILFICFLIVLYCFYFKTILFHSKLITLIFDYFYFQTYFLSILIKFGLLFGFYLIILKKSKTIQNPKTIFFENKIESIKLKFFTISFEKEELRKEITYYLKFLDTVKDKQVHQIIIERIKELFEAINVHLAVQV